MPAHFPAGRPKKLTDELVKDIHKWRFVRNWPYRRIAQRYKLSYSAVWIACNKSKWLKLWSDK